MKQTLSISELRVSKFNNQMHASIREADKSYARRG